MKVTERMKVKVGMTRETLECLEKVGMIRRNVGIPGETCLDKVEIFSELFISEIKPVIWDILSETLAMAGRLTPMESPEVLPHHTTKKQQDG